MRKHTRLTLLVATTLVCVGFVCLLLMIGRREGASDNLLARATRVADTADWASPFARSRGNAPPYFWRNDQEILHYVRDLDGEPGALALVLLDIRTGATRPVRANGKNVVLAASERGLSVSPDGAQLLCSGAKIGPVSLFTLALDGSGARRAWPVSHDGQGTFWDADSRGFVRFTPPLFGKPWQALRYHLDQPGAAPDLIAASALPQVSGLSPHGPLSPGVYLAYKWNPKTRPGESRFYALTLSLQGGARKAARCSPVTFTLPPIKPPRIKGLFGDEAIPQASPQGDRLLWCAERQQPPQRSPAWRRFLYRIFPTLSGSLWRAPAFITLPVFEVWVSDARGENPRFLGVLYPRITIGKSALTTSYSLSEPFWSPDGKQIAFWQNGALYVAPVPGR